jgi:Rap1a immunity proteins
MQHGKPMRSTVLAAIFALAATQANALTGTQLYRFCVEAPKGSVENTACNSYVRGFIDGLVTGVNEAADGRMICLPKDGIALEQGRLILEKALRDYPQFLHKEGGYLFGFGMMDAFHCP